MTKATGKVKCVFLKTDTEYREETFIGKDGKEHIKNIVTGGNEVFAVFPEWAHPRSRELFRAYTATEGDAECAKLYAAECAPASVREYKCLLLNLVYLRGIDVEVLDARQWLKENRHIVREAEANLDALWSGKYAA